MNGRLGVCFFLGLVFVRGEIRVGARRYWRCADDELLSDVLGSFRLNCFGNRCDVCHGY